MDVEQGVQRRHHQEKQRHPQQGFQTLTALQQQVIADAGHEARHQISRMLDHHTKADGSQKKYKIDDWVAFGKGIRIHVRLPPGKRKIPLTRGIGYSNAKPQEPPRSCRIESDSSYSGSGRLHALNLLRIASNESERHNVHLRRLGTAGIYPFQCLLTLLFCFILL